MAMPRQPTRDSSSESPVIDEIQLESRQLELNERGRLFWSRFKSYITSASIVRNKTSAIFILTICGICLQQCQSQVEEYFKYATRSQIAHTFPASPLWLLPGVTICNNNRLRMGRLTEQIPGLHDKLMKLEIDNTQPGPISEKKRLENMKLIKKAVEETVNISALMKESPIPRLLNLSTTSLIKDINCNNLWGQQFNCENFRIIESYQDGPCYTIFYLGAILEAIASETAYDFNTSLLGGQKKLDPFSSNELVEILLDFEPLQHADFQFDVGGKIMVHSTGHVGSARDTSHSLTPGNSYDVLVKRHMSARLPPPYQSMCRDYKRLHTKQFTEKDVSLPSVELDKTTCVRNCIVRNTTSACNCWPVEVPYYQGDTMIANSDQYKPCDWGSKENLNNETAALYINCFKKFHAECVKSCRSACNTEDYKVHVMSNPWPTREKFLLSTETEKKELTRLKGCCVKISLKYHGFLESRHNMYPSMTLAQLVSNMGGIVSALVGVSVIELYRYLTRNVFHCKIVNDYDPVEKSTMTGTNNSNQEGERITRRLSLHGNRLIGQTKSPMITHNKHRDSHQMFTDFRDPSLSNF